MRSLIAIVATYLFVTTGVEAPDTVTFVSDTYSFAENQVASIPVWFSNGPPYDSIDGGEVYFAVLNDDSVAGEWSFVDTDQTYVWSPAELATSYQLQLQINNVAAQRTFTLELQPSAPATRHSSSYTAAVTLEDTSGASGDPHLKLAAPGLEIPVCFDLTGLAGQVFKLIEGVLNDFVVFGRMRGDSYLDQIEMKQGADIVHVTADGIQASNVTFSWEKPPATVGQIRVERTAENQLDIKMATSAFRVERMDIESATPFLNLYVLEIGPKAGGIIGHVLTNKYHVTPLTGNDAMIFGGERHVMAQKRSDGDECWMVADEGEGLYPGRKEDYIVG